MTKRFLFSTAWISLITLATVALCQQGQGQAKVPVVIGQTATDAKATIANAGFEAEFRIGITAPKGVKPYTVYEQNPSAGETLSKGRKVTLTLYADAAPKPPESAPPAALDEQPSRPLESTGGDQREPSGRPDADIEGSSTDSGQIVSVVAQLLPKRHLSRHPLDDEIARRMMSNLLKSLDSQKHYFTQADVDRFHSQESALADQLRRGDLAAVNEVFDMYLRRLRERMALANELIDVDHDFSVTESMVTDDSKRQYAENEQQVRDLWRRRIKYQLLNHLAAGFSFAEARRLTHKMFDNFQQRANQWDETDRLEMALSAMTSAYDPHSTYISPRAYENFVISTRQELVGIGAALQMKDGYAEVARVVSGSPSDRDGRLSVGDRILAVGQGDSGTMTDVIGARLADAVGLIRGKLGTTVRLRVLPKGQFETNTYKIARDKLQMSAASGTVLSDEHLPEGRSGRVGFIRLPSFYGEFASGGSDDNRAEVHTASRDLRRALEAFEKDDVQAVILDLRNNGGGTLKEALNVAGLFLGDVPVMQVKNADGSLQTYQVPGAKIAWNRPLVVLTNSHTSGASEIASAALQDYGRALIVGDRRTHGYGTVQNVLDVGRVLFRVEQPPKLGHLKVTGARFYRVPGRSTQMVGVTPDVVLRSFADVMQVREENLPYALDTDVVNSLQIERTDYGIEKKLLDELRSGSESRCSRSPYFQNLRQRIDAYQMRQYRGTISLNKAEFLASRREGDETDDQIPQVPGVPEVKLDGYFREALSITLDYVSRMAFASAEAAYQARRFSEALRDYKTVTAADPQFSRGHYKLSWLLATCPRRDMRAGQLAVQHATKACELDGNETWYYILALAVAEAEAGDFDKAQEHLKNALEKAPANQRSKYQYFEQQFRNRQTP